MIKKIPAGMKMSRGKAGQEAGLARQAMGSRKVIRSMPLPKAKAKAKARAREARAGHVVDPTSNGSAQKDQEREKDLGQRAKARAIIQEEKVPHGQACGAGRAINQVTFLGTAQKDQEKE